MADIDYRLLLMEWEHTLLKVTNFMQTWVIELWLTADIILSHILQGIICLGCSEVTIIPNFKESAGGGVQYG